MKVDLKRMFRFMRRMFAAGAIAAAAFAGGSGTARAALVLSNGSFASPNVGTGYGYYNVGSNWNVHNLGAGYGGGDHSTGNNGNLVQFAQNNVNAGLPGGSQYAAAVLWDTPANVFSQAVGTTLSGSSGMYVNQTLGSLTNVDANATYNLSADLIRILGTVYDITAGGQSPTPSVAGAGVTIGFANANTGVILAESPISYTTSYAAGDQTTVNIAGSLSWSPSASGVAAGTPISAFIGFRLDPSYSNYLNSVAVTNLVLSDNIKTLTWSGADPTSPTQWSTNSGVLNWSSGGTASAYSDGLHTFFDDSVGTGSTTVNITAGNVAPASVTFNNNAKNYTISGAYGITGPTGLALTGGGMVTITNSNSYTGPTTISSGTLQLGSGASGQDGVISSSVLNNSVLVYNLAGSQAPGYAINGTGSVIKTGSGVLTFNSALGYTGGTIVNGGTLALGYNNGVTGTLQGSLTINPGGTVFCAVNNALGYGGGNWVQTININGGVLSTGVTTDNGWGTTITMTAGTVSTTVAGGYFAMGDSPVFNINAATAPSVISADLHTRETGPGIVFNVSRGSRATDLLISGNIVQQVTNAVTFNGNGITVLTGVNTYQGATTLGGGTLQLGDGTTGHDGTINATSGVTNNAALVYNLYGDQSISYAIGGTGSLTKLGQNQLTLTGFNSYSGTTTVVAGILNINVGDSSTGIAVSGGTLNLNVASPATSVSVAGGATLAGTGSLVSAAANVANGGILDFRQNAGNTFLFGGLSYAGSSTLNLGPLTPSTSAVPFLQSTGTISTAGQISLNANLGAAGVLSGTYDLVNFSAIAGTGTSAFKLSVNGLGTRQSAALVDISNELEVVIGGPTPYWSGNQPDWLSTNAWTLQPGNTPTTFQVGDADVFDDSASTLHGGAVAINTGNVAPNAVTFNNLNLAYTVSGNFGITGSGGLAVQGGGSVTILNANSYTGGTIVNSGTLQLGNGGATGSLSPSSAIALGGNGVLAFSRSNAAVQGVDFSGSQISGAGSLVQNGPGALIFTANNNYTGTTTISGGTLQLGVGGMNGSLSPASTINLNNAVLDFDRSDNVTIPNTINGSNFTLLQNGSGTTALTTQQTQGGGLSSGTVDINAGRVVLNFAPASSANGGPFGGSNVWNIASGGTLECAQQRVTRYQDTYNVNGTVLFSQAYGNFRNYLLSLNLSGGSLLGTSFGSGYNAGTAGGAGVGTWNVAGGATSTIAADLYLVNGGYNELDVNVASGAAATPLLWSGSIIDEDPINATFDGMTLRKLGSGLMVMTGTANAYKATAFIIDGGAVQIGSGGTAGTMLPCPVTDNASLIFDRAGSLTVASAISGSGSVTQNGSGATVLTASNTYTGATMVNAGALYVNGSLATPVTVNGGVLGGSGTAPSASVAVGGGIEGGYKGTGTLTLTSLAYAGSGSFTPSAYASHPASSSAAALDVTGNNGLNPGTGPVAVNLGTPIAISNGTYHLIQYSGAIGGSGSSAFTLGTVYNTPRGQLSYGLVNNPRYLDVSVNVTPVIWTGSLSTAWNATDTLPAPKNWSYAGSGTNFLAGDFVQFDNSTASGGNVNISNGDVLPTVVVFNNDAAHPYTVTGTNGIGGTAEVVKNGPGIVTMTASNSYSGGTVVNAGTLQVGNAATNGTIGSGAYNVAAGGRLYLNYATAVPGGDGTWSANIFGAGTLELNSAQGVNGSANWGPNSATATVFSPGFTGTLQVDNGRIDSSPAGLGGLSNIIINADAQFLAWSGTYSQSVTIAGNTWGEPGYPGALRAAANTVTTWAGPITLSADAGIEAQNGSVFTLSGAITGNHQVEFETFGTGPGIINLVPSGTTQNSYGSAKVDTGTTVTAGNQYAFSTGGLLMNAGVLQTNGFNFSFANLADTGAGGTVGNYSATGTSAITVGTDNTSSTYGGTIIDGGGEPLALIKTGSGTLTLSGINGYTGGTTVENGTLIVTNNEGLADGSNLYVGTTAGLALLGGYPAPIVPSAASAGGASAPSPVPEPGTLGLLAAVVCGAAVCHRLRPQRKQR